MSKESIIVPHAEVRTIDVGSWVTRVGPEVPLNERSNVEAFTRYRMEEYQRAFRPAPGTEHYFYNAYGVSSPIVRLDMPLITGEIPEDQGFFEIEARPGGNFMAAQIDERFGHYFQGVVEQVRGETGRDVAVKVLPYSNPSQNDATEEKAAFAELLGVDFHGPGEKKAPDDNTLYFVYGDSPAEGDDVEGFEQASLWPVRDDGNKDYLVRMDRALHATPELIDEQLEQKVPFVLKPRQGMWARDVYAFHGSNKNRMNGSMSADQIVRALNGDNVNDYLMQQLITPTRIQFPDQKRYSMARMYAVYDIAQGAYEPVGGYYVAGNTFKLHVTPDALVGPLTGP